MTKTPAAKDPTRNVWLQLGFPDAEEHFLKAELVLRLDKAINSLGLTQRAAARRIGTTQPELSKILGGKFTEVSLERLMRFLTALSGAPRSMKLGTKASPWRYDGARQNTMALPVGRPRRRSRFDLIATRGYSVSTSSSLTPRPARRLFRACSMRRRNRGSCSRRYSNQSSSDSKPINTPAGLP